MNTNECQLKIVVRTVYGMIQNFRAKEILAVLEGDDSAHILTTTHLFAFNSTVDYY